MGGEKMMNKKAATLGGVFMTIILVMGLFFGLFGYLVNSYDDAGIETDSDYLALNDSITYWQTNLTTNVNDIEDSASQISEADANVFQVAWNGLTGLASTIQLFFGLIAVSIGLSQALLPQLNFLPFWVIPLTRVAITIIIVLVIIGAFKGESKT